METKFNFNSQVCTNIAQSRRLLELGLKKETADMSYSYQRTSGDYELSVVEYAAILRLKDRMNNRKVLGLGWNEMYGNDIPAWSLHRLMELLASKWGECMVFLPDAYDEIISDIEIEIGRGSFNKEFLV